MSWSRDLPGKVRRKTKRNRQLGCRKEVWDKVEEADRLGTQSTFKSTQQLSAGAQETLVTSCGSNSTGPLGILKTAVRVLMQNSSPTALREKKACQPATFSHGWPMGLIEERYRPTTNDLAGEEIRNLGGQRLVRQRGRNLPGKM
jgi:hypothetical protein